MWVMWFLSDMAFFVGPIIIVEERKTLTKMSSFISHLLSNFWLNASVSDDRFKFTSNVMLLSLFVSVSCSILRYPRGNIFIVSPTAVQYKVVKSGFVVYVSTEHMWYIIQWNYSVVMSKCNSILSFIPSIIIQRKIASNSPDNRQNVWLRWLKLRIVDRFSWRFVWFDFVIF